MRAKVDAETRRVKMQRSLNYELAALIRVGFHDPKNFPAYDAFFGEQRREASPDDLHDYLMALSLRSAPSSKTTRTP